MVEAVSVRWLALGAGVVLNAVANILIKAAARGLPADWQARPLWRVAMEPYLVLGIVSFALALAFYGYALTHFELSVAYPIMTSVGLVLVFLWSVAFFEERFTGTKFAATTLILVGVVLLARGG